MPLVSVIIPCHNRAAFVPAAAQSIRAQTLQDWELLLVDDGSVDNTFEVLGSLAKQDGRIRAFRRPHQGVGHARNFGVSQSSPASRYLFFLDDDDELNPEALDRMSQYLEMHPAVGLVACQFQEIDVDGRQVGQRTRSRWAPSRFGFPRQLRPEEIETPFVTFYCATGQGPFALYRRAIFSCTGGWETNFWPHEDTDLFCQMALLAKVHFLPERLYRKRLHGTNVVQDHERMARAYGQFRGKWDRFQSRSRQESETLRAADFFYRASFRPLRHLKVASKAVAAFLRGGDAGELRWACRLCWHALSDAIQSRLHYHGR